MKENDQTYSQLKANKIKPENERVELYDTSMVRNHEIQKQKRNDQMNQTADLTQLARPKSLTKMK